MIWIHSTVIRLRRTLLKLNITNMESLLITPICQWPGLISESKSDDPKHPAHTGTSHTPISPSNISTALITIPSPHRVPPKDSHYKYINLVLRLRFAPFLSFLFFRFSFSLNYISIYTDPTKPHFLLHLLHFSPLGFLSFFANLRTTYPAPSLCNVAGDAYNYFSH